MGNRTQIEWTATIKPDGTVVPGATWTPIRARVKQNAAEIARAKGYGSLVQIAERMKGHVGPHCEKVSELCTYCYSETNNCRCLPHNGTGLPFDRRSRDLVDIFLDEKILEQPLRWREPKKVFVCSQTDLFGEFVPDGMILDLWRIMFRCPQHTFQILTKRPDRMLDWCKRFAETAEDDYEPKLARGPEAVRDAHKSGRARLFADMIEGWGKPPDGAAYPTYDWMEGMIRWPAWLPNVWLGVSVGTQPEADRDIPKLLQTPAAARFLSLEPLLGPMNISHYLGSIDWVIVGGESGAHARPMHPDWVRSLRDQCVAAGVPFFFKQWGEWESNDPTKSNGASTRWIFEDGRSESPGESLTHSGAYLMRRVGKHAAGRLLDGREWNEFPKGTQPIQL